jgi:hypothetical protein
MSLTPLPPSGGAAAHDPGTDLTGAVLTRPAVRDGTCPRLRPAAGLGWVLLALLSAACPAAEDRPASRGSVGTAANVPSVSTDAGRPAATDAPPPISPDGTDGLGLGGGNRFVMPNQTGVDGLPTTGPAAGPAASGGQPRDGWFSPVNVGAGVVALAAAGAGGWYVVARRRWRRAVAAAAARRPAASASRPAARVIPPSSRSV